jgi:hypothetical protein
MATAYSAPARPSSTPTGLRPCSTGCWSPTWHRGSAAHRPACDHAARAAGHQRGTRHRYQCLWTSAATTVSSTSPVRLGGTPTGIRPCSTGCWSPKWHPAQIPVPLDVCDDNSVVDFSCEARWWRRRPTTRATSGTASAHEGTRSLRRTFTRSGQVQHFGWGSVDFGGGSHTCRRGLPPMGGSSWSLETRRGGCHTLVAASARVRLALPSTRRGPVPSTAVWALHSEDSWQGGQ